MNSPMIANATPAALPTAETSEKAKRFGPRAPEVAPEHYTLGHIAYAGLPPEVRAKVNITQRRRLREGLLPNNCEAILVMADHFDVRAFRSPSNVKVGESELFAKISTSPGGAVLPVLAKIRATTGNAALTTEMISKAVGAPDTAVRAWLRAERTPTIAEARLALSLLGIPLEMWEGAVVRRATAKPKA